MPATTTADLQTILERTQNAAFSWLDQHGAIVAPDSITITDDAPPFAAQVKALAFLLGDLNQRIEEWSALNQAEDDPDCAETRHARALEITAFGAEVPEESLLAWYRALPPWKPAK